MFYTSFESSLYGENEFFKEKFVKLLQEMLKIEISVKLPADLAMFRKNHGTQAFSSTYLVIIHVNRAKKKWLVAATLMRHLPKLQSCKASPLFFIGRDLSSLQAFCDAKIVALL